MRFWFISAVAISQLACVAQATVFSDNFDASTPSTFWRTVIGGTGPSVSQTSGELDVTIPSSATGSTLLAGFQSRCAVSGNFDAQVDYQLVGPKPNVGLLELFAWEFAGGNPMGGVARDFQAVFGDSYVVFRSFMPGARVPTTDTVGRIRLQRVGSTTHGYYDSGGAWIDIGQVTFPTADAIFGIFATGGPGPTGVAGAFDNFSLQADGISCPLLNELCGDGMVQTPGEQCDDGNAAGDDGCCDCRSGSLSPPDVAGSWQQNVACTGELTVVRTLTLTQTAGSSAATLTPSGCGTFFSDGELHQISTCSASPQPAQVCGTTFAYYPPEGTVDVDPFSSALGTCSDVSRVSGRERFRGTITTDGANKATRIAGLQGFDFLKLFNVGEVAPCYETVGTLCGFDMRRNDVTGGGSTTIEPLTGVTITFSGANDVVVKVIPQTTPSATVPPNFQVVGNTSGAFYLDIQILQGSYASGPGANEVCLSYPDANPSDGTVDNTNPPVDENSLQILHEETLADGSVEFIDRTSSRDPVNNKVCAKVGSFSQFLLGVGPAPTLPSLCNATPRTDCRKPTTPNAASALIKNKTAKDKTVKSQLTWKWQGAATAKADFGDPLTITDYQLCVYDRSAGTLIPALGASAPAGGTCGTAACWKDQTKGFKYKDKDTTPDGLFQLDLKEGTTGKAKITVKAKEPRLHALVPMQKDPSVTVQLVNSAGTCWDADFSTFLKNDSKQFKAKSD